MRKNPVQSSHQKKFQNDKNEKLVNNPGYTFTRFQKYLAEFVYGGMDGSVTTFAVVAGSTGAISIHQL